MKKTFTHSGEISESTFKSRQAATPRATTMAFLRQFARAYRPAPALGMPGVVLN